ncbi:MAG: bifunctional diguanylate cyclase/phosphodiesterase [Sulfurimonadaceae bacterium]
MKNNEHKELNQAVENFSLTLQKRVDYDRLTFLYMSLPFILTGHLLGSFLFSALQYQVVDTYSIVIWLALSIFVILWRWYHFMQFKNVNEATKLKESTIWLHHYYIDVIMSGVVWGWSALLLFPTDNYMGQIIVMVFIFAVSFATISSLSSKLMLLLLYLVVTFSPLVARLVILDETYSFTALIIVLALVALLIFIAEFFGAIINNSLSNHQNFVQAKHENDTLKERFFSLFERAPVGIFYYNEDLKIIDSNERFIQLHDMDKLTLMHQDLHQIKNQEALNQFKTVFDNNSGYYRGVFTPIKSEKQLFVELSTVPLIDNANNVTGGICILEDITAEVDAKEEILRRVYYDILTNIPNRTLFMDRLERALFNSKNNNGKGAVIYIDIDNFKSFNDTLGHHNGDVLLQQIANRIGKLGREENMVARLSGDDFVILITGLPPQNEQAKESAMLIAKSYKDQFLQPFIMNNQEYHVNTSMGVSFFPNINESPYDVLKRAETAMYHAKKQGRNRIEFHQKDMDEEISVILDVENRLRAAIKHNEFELFYQPQVDISTNTIVSAEALIRWKQKDGSYIMPGQFIPIAEASGLILPMSAWIIETAIKQMITWKEQDNPLKIDRVAINISAIHFGQVDFVEQIKTILNKHAIDPKQIELELTESIALVNIEETIQKIEELKEIGISFALDDFGTGYSSLAYLKRLPIDYLKIDQSFIKNMMVDSEDKLITDTIVSVAQSFKLKVIAEGVEDKEQLEHLKSIECDIYQGYLRNRPVSAEDFETMVRDLD